MLLAALLTVVTAPGRCAETPTADDTARFLAGLPPAADCRSKDLQSLIRGSERPVHSAKQPADAESHERSRVWLGLDGVAKPLVERDGCLTRGIRCLAVQVLRSAGGLVEPPFDLSSYVSSRASDSFLDLAAQISR
jgi:hypothetical protein